MHSSQTMGFIQFMKDALRFCLMKRKENENIYHRKRPRTLTNRYVSSQSLCTSSNHSSKTFVIPKDSGQPKITPINQLEIMKRKDLENRRKVALKIIEKERRDSKSSNQASPSTLKENFDLRTISGKNSLSSPIDSSLGHKYDSLKTSKSSEVILSEQKEVSQSEELPNEPALYNEPSIISSKTSLTQITSSSPITRKDQACQWEEQDEKQENTKNTMPTNIQHYPSQDNLRMELNESGVILLERNMEDYKFLNQSKCLVEGPIYRVKSLPEINFELESPIKTRVDSKESYENKKEEIRPLALNRFSCFYSPDQNYYSSLRGIKEDPIETDAESLYVNSALYHKRSTICRRNSSNHLKIRKKLDRDQQPRNAVNLLHKHSPKMARLLKEYAEI